MSDAMLLLSCLTQSLAHELRTGLSILNNELTYINTKLADNDCGTALDRCRKMADYLRQLTALGGPRLVKSAHSLREFLYLSPIAAAPARPLPLTESDLVLEIDSARWGMALRNLLALFIGAFPASQSTLTYDMDAKGVILNFAFAGAGGEALENPAPKSLSEFFNIAHDRENVLAPLADAIFMAHGAALSFERSADKISLRLWVPRAE